MQEQEPNAGKSSGKCPLLEDCSFEELAVAVTARLAADRERAAQQLAEVEAAERKLEEKQRMLEEMEQRIFAITDNADDLVELNVGGQPMSTTRKVLCSAEGSLLAGMFSGNFDGGHKRDKENRIFLDVDPDLFKKLLSHLRLRRIASPECPAPLPHVPEDQRAEYDMLVKYYGLETFMYGEIGSSGNIFQRIAELAGVNQAKLQTHEMVRIILSSTGGVPATNHEEVLGPSGFHERSLENSYGAHPNTITIKFLRHRIRVEAMELRAKVADIVAHMSNQWSFRHGSESINMNFAFSRVEPETGRMETTGLGGSFADEVAWTFPRDFCLEHIVLYGRVMAK
uniref:Potassium channel tetramerisation-type BTB domain-containing protein n=1 Tax=Pyrodinium bahamense TaxID=73915 RepID=A0A7S0FBT9_9DINO|mmetsp:Transcript_20712/g.57287  ORF Transcript_20712/g.57287 Transcript_20712/m.57287 type:complete len:341 (+) Transcript_20712:98-1120(+)|eukprot:CAMPEP_0179137434 /NCGR_PEP_ID=MMETSP0796-20121207/65562_1 /TAXON_ID=73915 /ORGANISM="Pyrodinium bahamense, Strain pbaha01" /LENGTH=340 /DNA_ID=CAMNT_0020836613 /DNA_START=26 /DNA_END=1048 /DNA_ORIENTATION=+